VISIFHLSFLIGYSFMWSKDRHKKNATAEIGSGILNLDSSNSVKRKT